MLNANQFADLPDFLESCVNKIKKSYPRFSSLQLSKKLGIPNSTFDRIAKKEVKNPSFNYALKIVQEVSTEESIQTFIKKFYPKMYENFESVYPGNKDVPFVVAEAEAYFQDPSTYELLIMATSSEGLTRERTLEEFGRRGLGILDKLITNGILKENNGKVSIDGPINAKQDTVKQVLQNLIKFNYDLDSFGDNKNWLSVQYESVNTEVALPQLRDICIEANQKIREVMNNPESKGRDVVWAGIAMDSLVKHSDLLINNKKVLQ